jgi:hypothetical protein
VRLEAEKPVDRFFKTTCARTTAAPDESATSPRKEEAEFWATRMIAGKNNQKRKID